MSILSEETLEKLREQDDKTAAQGFLLGLAILLKAGADAAAVLVFATDYINAVRLAEVGRVPIRDEGAN